MNYQPNITCLNVAAPQSKYKVEDYRQRYELDKRMNVDKRDKIISFERFKS